MNRQNSLRPTAYSLPAGVWEAANAAVEFLQAPQQAFVLRDQACGGGHHPKAQCDRQQIVSFRG